MDGPMVPAVVLVEIRRQLADLQSTISALTSQLATKDKEIERLNQLLLDEDDLAAEGFEAVFHRLVEASRREERPECGDVRRQVTDGGGQAGRPG